MSKITAIVLAAGQGKRMNSQVAKQFLNLLGKPVLYYSLKAFEESSIENIILVTGCGQVEYCRDSIVKKYHFSKVSDIIEGGKERYDSVYMGLNSIVAADYVLIHDGARPFLSVELIESIIEHVMTDRACIAGIPVKETIKVVNSESIITSTPNRDTLWAAQTPQAFEYTLIKKAYDLLYADEDKNRTGITDDAMVYENYLKLPVKMVYGDYNNLKITTPEDLYLAEEILNHLLCEKNKKKEQLLRE